ncbi:MAG: helix-turn-helix transcriptional regulator [Desulfobacter sp.]|nr:MAG: helix-turn-helix transcriptional regulator [Desulfobacter sp.]
MNECRNFDFSIVRSLRMKRGITAEALANQANITRATVVKLESGKGNPTVETLNAIGKVFGLTASQLIQMAETGGAESGRTAPYDRDGFKGVHISFPGFEAFHLKAPKGCRSVSVPELHDHTAEICLVTSGRLRISVMGTARELGPGEALRFKALHEHELEIMEDAQLLLIHHLLT